ncbi:MAG: hypothetical protein ACLP50_05845 [Solirubrobacteraceae bacterium]
MEDQAAQSQLVAVGAAVAVAVDLAFSELGLMFSSQFQHRLAR